MDLRARKDGYRLSLPKEFIPEPVNEKYSKILSDLHSFTISPIEYVNESIQKLEVFGFQGATVTQQQGGRGVPTMNQGRTLQNNFLHTQTEHSYRSEANPVSLVDKTLNVEFRHTLGYINYMIIFESFMYQYSRDMREKDIPKEFYIDLIDHSGSVWGRIVLKDPYIDAMDMLDFDYSQPTAQSGTFKVVWKYSNFDYQLIKYDANTEKTI